MNYYLWMRDYDLTRNYIIEVEFCLWARADCEFERRGKCRAMTKNEEARERPLLKARRFGTSTSSVQAHGWKSEDVFFVLGMEKDKFISAGSM